MGSCSLGPGQADTLISGLRRYVRAARSCRADLKNRQSVLRTLWRVHRYRVLGRPAEFRTPMSHEIVLSMATSAWLQCPRTFLLSFHCSLLPAEARRLPWCDIQTYWITVNTLRKSSWHRDTETRRMANHAAQQRVLLDCPGNSQSIKTVISSVPDHDLTQQFGHSLLLPLRLSQRGSATSSCYINVTRVTDVERRSFRSLASTSRRTATTTRSSVDL